MNQQNLTNGRVNQKKETRAIILDAARTLLEKQGTFRLEDAATEAGVSRATIYRYFSNVDVLVAEAGLDITIDSPEEIYKKIKDDDLETQLLSFLTYINHVTLTNEEAFRSYLSKVIVADSNKETRGKRRIRILMHILKHRNLDSDIVSKLINICTIFSGIEPIIVAKDVCGLDNKQTIDLLNWALEKIISGLELQEAEPTEK